MQTKGRVSSIAGCGMRSTSDRSASRGLRAIVRDYELRYRSRADEEVESFALCRSVREAAGRAGRAENPAGKRFAHQRRLTRAALRRAEATLVRRLPTLRRAASFDSLHAAIRQHIGGIRGIGELMVYDTALRLGARFGLEPDRVYLHAGTRRGTRRLGLDVRAGSVSRSDLPSVLRVLPARCVEDILCIYKDDF